MFGINPFPRFHNQPEITWPGCKNSSIDWSSACTKCRNQFQNPGKICLRIIGNWSDPQVWLWHEGREFWQIFSFFFFFFFFFFFYIFFYQSLKKSCLNAIFCTLIFVGRIDKGRFLLGRWDWWRAKFWWSLSIRFFVGIIIKVPDLVENIFWFGSLFSVKNGWKHFKI